jgi:hypothetical protein
MGLEVFFDSGYYKDAAPMALKMANTFYRQCHRHDIIADQPPKNTKSKPGIIANQHPKRKFKPVGLPSLIQARRAGIFVEFWFP